MKSQMSLELERTCTRTPLGAGTSGSRVTVKGNVSSTAGLPRSPSFTHSPVNGAPANKCPSSVKPTSMGASTKADRYADIVRKAMHASSLSMTDAPLRRA